MSRPRAYGILVGVSLLWGSVWLLGPTLAGAAQPFAIGALLFGIAALAVLPWAFRAVRKPAPPSMAFLPGSAFLIGSAFLGGPQALLILAGRHGISGWAPLLASALPLLLGLRAGAWTPPMAAAPACVLILLNGSVPSAPAKLGWALCALAAVLLQAWAFGFLAHRCRGIAVGPLLAASCAYAALELGIASLCLEHPLRLTLPGGGWAALAVVGIAGTALPYAGLFALLLGGVWTPAQAASGLWLQLLVAAGESAALVRARVPASVALAGAALLACLWSVLRLRESQDELPARLFRENP